MRDLSDVLGKGWEVKVGGNSLREQQRLQWNERFEAEVVPQEGDREGHG